MMGLSEYYFPIFEQALKERGLPLELKYLSVVESALNPMAVSRVVATGLWQFMYTTTTVYELTMISFSIVRMEQLAAKCETAFYLDILAYTSMNLLLAFASSYLCRRHVPRVISRV